MLSDPSTVHPSVMVATSTRLGGQLGFPCHVSQQGFQPPCCSQNAHLPSTITVLPCVGSPQHMRDSRARLLSPHMVVPPSSRRRAPTPRMLQDTTHGATKHSLNILNSSNNQNAGTNLARPCSIGPTSQDDDHRFQSLDVRLRPEQQIGQIGQESSESGPIMQGGHTRPRTNILLCNIIQVLQ